jgi:uncharacterized SAM-binding protein YcdF (DUF218 family)
MSRSFRLPKLKLRLIRRRTCWTLTARGWLVTLFCLVLLLTGGVSRLYPFLAVNAAMQADSLVAEGWIADESLKAAVTELNACASYKFLITTGGPLPRGFYLSQYKTFAELAAATVLKLGVPQDRVIVVPADYVTKDRTYATAIALKQQLERAHPDIRSINVVTEGTHARRTWSLYKKVLEPSVKVGIISIPSQDYTPERWWASSAGVRSVLPEAIAYVYAILFERLN